VRSCLAATVAEANLLKLIFRNAVPVGVTVLSHPVPEGFAAALSSRSGRAAKAEPVAYDLGRLLRCVTEGATAMTYSAGKAELSGIERISLPTKQASHKPQVMLVLALVGTGVAFYDAYQLYNGQPLWCPPPINGCNEVANSAYARIFNLPVAYYGVVYYLYMFCLAAVLAYDPFSRGLRLAALIYSGIGVGFSIYFSYLQVTLIHAFCIYCLISAVTTLLLFAAAVSHFRATRTSD
jgi:uncharacterized membrane protein